MRSQFVIMSWKISEFGHNARPGNMDTIKMKIPTDGRRQYQTTQVVIAYTTARMYDQETKTGHFFLRVVKILIREVVNHASSFTGS